MLGGEVVVVEDGDAAERRHGDGHGGLGDGVHGGGDAGDGEIEVAGELGGEIDGVGGEIDVVRKEDDVVVGVGEALVEEAGGREAVFDRVSGHGAGILSPEVAEVGRGVLGLEVRMWVMRVFKSIPGLRFGESGPPNE